MYTFAAIYQRTNRGAVEENRNRDRERETERGPNPSDKYANWKTTDERIGDDDMLNMRVV